MKIAKFLLLAVIVLALFAIVLPMFTTGNAIMPLWVTSYGLYFFIIIVVLIVFALLNTL